MREKSHKCSVCENEFNFCELSSFVKYWYRYRYKPIAYFFLGLCIGIGLLSKIQYRSMPDKMREMTKVRNTI